MSKVADIRTKDSFLVVHCGGVPVEDKAGNVSISSCACSIPIDFGLSIDKLAKLLLESEWLLSQVFQEDLNATDAAYYAILCPHCAIVLYGTDYLGVVKKKIEERRARTMS